MLAVLMKTQALLQQLIEADRALQKGDCAAARSILFEAQDSVLQIERDMIDMQTEKVRRTAPARIGIFSGR